MNRIILRSAISASLTLLAGVAGAAAPITYPVPGANVVNLSGATATDIALADALINNSANGICDPASDIDVYTTEVDFLNQSAANYAVVCKTKATVTPAAVAGVEVVVRKYSGGSGSGIGNVASGALVNPDNLNNRQWVDYEACRTAPPARTGGGANPELNVNLGAGRQVATRVYRQCQTAAGQVTVGGLSDVEPALLGTSATVQGQLVIRPGVAVGFAPIVSLPLFLQLQTAEGITQTPVLASETSAVMPNLSSAQVRGIFSGKITTAAFLYSNPPADTGSGTVFGAAGGTQNIFVCRRGNSSGTQTSFQIHYLRQGCGTAGVGTSQLQFVAPTGAGVTNNCAGGGCGWDPAVYQNDRVFAGTGSADVVACVNYHSSVGHYAVGVLSTETLADDTANAVFRHVKVDGSAPSLENIVAGAYDFFTENTFNTPGATAPTRTINTITSVQDNMPTALLNSFKSQPTLKAGLQAHPFGWGGLLAIPASANSSLNPPVGMADMNASVLANPTNSQTRANAFGTVANNCNPSFPAGRTLAPIDRAAF
jgi:hypothetical protein